MLEVKSLTKDLPISGSVSDSFELLIYIYINMDPEQSLRLHPFGLTYLQPTPSQVPRQAGGR